MILYWITPIIKQQIEMVDWNNQVLSFFFLRLEKEDPINDKAVWLSGLWLMESSK